MNEYIEPIPSSVLEFEKRYNEKHPEKRGVNNIYHIVTEDLDGNIVDEHFGVNVLTDMGFTNIYTRTYNNAERTHYIYAGDGDFVTLDPTSTSLVHAISSNYATTVATTYSFSYCKWSSDLNANIVTYRLCSGYFDYTVWDSDKTVTELGVATEYYTVTGLKYHAAIYDANGDKSSFVKHVNERVTISVYIRSLVPIANIINALWDSGIPSAIVSYPLVKIYYNSEFYNASATLATYHMNAWDNPTAWLKYTDFVTSTVGSIVDHVYTCERDLTADLLLSNTNGYVSELIFSSQTTFKNIYRYGIWCLVHKIKSPNPISFQCDTFRTYSAGSQSFKDTYGRYTAYPDYDAIGQLPMTDMHISSVKMYNAQTDEYDISVPFSEPISYLETGYYFLRFGIREYGWNEILNDYRWFTVFINEAPDYPISKIINCNVSMYATDEYWDSSTWELIPNTENISSTLGSKRYFITFESEFTADSNIEHYVPEHKKGRQIERATLTANIPKLSLNSGYESEMIYYGIYYNSATPSRSYFYGASASCYKSIQNETLGYIASGGFIIYPESEDPNPTLYYNASKPASFAYYPYRYHIGGIDLTEDVPMTTGYGKDGCHPSLIWNTTNGEHIACMGQKSWSRGIRVYTITNDPSIPPTYDDFTFDAEFTANPVWSHTNNGYVVISYISGTNNVDTSYIVEYDVNNVTPNMYKLEGYKCAFAIDLTNFLCAIDTSVVDHVRLIIYDMADRTITDTVDLPSGYTFSGFAGWKNFLYIRVMQGVTPSTFVYYLSEKVLESTNINIPQMAITTSSYITHIQRAVEANGNVESCMVLLASDADPTNQTHKIFKESDPTNPFDVIYKYDYQTSSFVKNQNAWLGYSADNKHLLLTLGTRRSMCLDIGKVLKHGTINKHLTRADYYNESNNRYSIIYYKGFIYQVGMDFYQSSNVGGTYPFSGSNEHSISSFIRYPFQQWMDLQLNGSTHTINSYMNPVKIQGTVGTMLYQSTNRDIDDPFPVPT